MIEIGDFVREKGGSQLLRAMGYNSATDQFRVQLGNSPIPIRFVDRGSLELVEKAPNGDFGGPGVIPEHWVTE